MSGKRRQYTEEFKESAVKPVRPSSDVRNLLGTKGTNQTEKELRLDGYRIDGKDFWVATNRYDLTAEEVAQVYKPRWNIETFFGWWKRQLKVYHLIARGIRVHGSATWWAHYLSVACNLLPGAASGACQYLQGKELRNQIANEAAAEQSQRAKKQGKSNNIRQLKRKKRDAKT
jgi:hypothetical protein